MHHDGQLLCACVHVHNPTDHYFCIHVARWGRCQEGYGEDPYVQAQLATQYVTALQNVKASKYVEAVVSRYV